MVIVTSCWEFKWLSSLREFDGMVKVECVLKSRCFGWGDEGNVLYEEFIGMVKEHIWQKREKLKLTT